jgi:hypothetical protein
MEVLLGALEFLLKVCYVANKKLTKEEIKSKVLLARFVEWRDVFHDAAKR